MEIVQESHYGEVMNTLYPKPGSKEAKEQGCTCPILDNHYGEGYCGGVKDEKGHTVYVVNTDCPIHGEEATKKYVEDIIFNEK